MSDDDRPEPAPEIAAEAKAFAAQIGALLDADPDDIPDLLSFTITVPREQALMAAWVMLKEDTGRWDSLPVVLDLPVRLHLDDGRRTSDWEQARRYFQRAIFESFDRDYTKLLMQTHPLLFPPPPKPPDPPRVEGDGDDDIPF